MTIVSVGQLKSTASVAQNILSTSQLIHNAARSGSKMIFLPEASDFIAHDHKHAAELCRNHSLEFISKASECAKSNNIWVSVGFHEPSNDPNLVYNSQAIINNSGQIVQVYKKIHLFDIDIPNGPCIKESQGTIPGSEILFPVDSPAGKLGLCICYDLRFPEQSALLRRKGAELLSYPSAFTLKTGAAHWEILLKARAIETQTFVVAAAQVGEHNSKRSSYGHSLIIDPWGTILAQCNQEENCFVSAEVDLEQLKTIRLQIPIEDHKRYDVYRSC